MDVIQHCGQYIMDDMLRLCFLYIFLCYDYVFLYIFIVATTMFLPYIFIVATTMDDTIGTGIAPSI